MIKIVLNVGVIANGALAKHQGSGILNMVRIPEMVTITRHMSPIKRAVVLHGVWKNHSVMMANLQSCKMVNGFVFPQMAAVVFPVNLQYAEQDQFDI